MNIKQPSYPAISRGQKALIDWWSIDSRLAAWIGLFSLAGFAALIGGLLAYRGASHQGAMPWDSVGILGISWRIYSGQIPHTDFSTAIGATPFWIIASAMRVTGPNANAFATASVLALPVMLGWAWTLACSRLPQVPSLVFSIFIGLLFIGVQPLGSEISAPSYAMLYNRMGWSWFGILALESLLPAKRSHPLSIFLSGVSTGVALALLFFTKLNYTAGALLVVGASWLLYRSGPMRYLGVFAGVSLTIGAHLQWLHLSLDAFLQDQFAALTGHGNQVGYFMLEAAGFSRFELLFLALALFFSWPWLVASAHFPAARFGRAPLLAPLVLLLSGLLIASANMQQGEYPIFGIATLLMAETIRRQLTNAPAQFLALSLTALISIFLLGLPVIKDLTAVAYTTAWKHWREPKMTALNRVDTPSLRTMVLPSRPGEGSEQDALASIRRGMFTSFSYGVWLRDGLGLLQAHQLTHARILCFDYFNPFPFLLLAPAPKEDQWCWDFGRLVTEESAPASARLFADVDAVMVPKYPLAAKTTPTLMRLYREALETRYVVSGESSCWTLWQRR